MRETFKDVEIGKRKFRLSKFDALTGSYIVYAVLTQILPMGIGEQIEGLPSAAEGKPVSIMPKEKFIEIQKDCLKCCAEIVPAGGTIAPVSVMLPDGRWGVPDIEQDAAMALLLTVNVLGYNVKSFFDANTLEMFKSGFAPLT